MVNIGIYKNELERIIYKLDNDSINYKIRERKIKSGANFDYSIRVYNVKFEDSYFHELIKFIYSLRK